MGETPLDYFYLVYTSQFRDHIVPFKAALQTGRYFEILQCVSR